MDPLPQLVKKFLTSSSMDTFSKDIIFFQSWEGGGEGGGGGKLVHKTSSTVSSGG